MKDSFSYYRENTQPLKALQFSDKASSVYLSKKDYPNYVTQIRNKVIIYFALNDYEKAPIILYQALLNIEKEGKNKEKAFLYSLLARSYLKAAINNKAIETAKIGLQYSNNTKDTVAYFLNQTILKAYLTQPNTEKAFKYLEPELTLAKKLKNDSKIFDAYNDHYAFYTQIKERDIAKKFLDSALIYAEKSKIRKHINTSKLNLGVHYLLEDINYTKARDIYLKILKDNPNDSTSTDVTTAYLNLSYTYEHLNDYKSANIYINKFLASYENTIDSKIEGVQTKYEIEKAEQQFSEKEAKLKQQQFRSQKMLYLLIALLALSAVLFYFFYQNLKLKQKDKLKDVNHKAQQNLINATIDGQEEERKRLSGVLHDNISALLSSANLHLMAFESNYPSIKEELAKTKAIIKEAHDKVRDLSHDLIPPVLEKLGLIPALEDLCEKNSNSLIHFNFSNFAPEKQRFQADFEMKIYFIVAELFNNIIKHSNATEAFLTIDQDQDQLSINIEDNGKGFSSKSDSDKSDKKEGFGLSQIKSRVKSMNGTMTINSKPENGTLIYIKVKIEEVKSNPVTNFNNI